MFAFRAAEVSFRLWLQPEPCCRLTLEQSPCRPLGRAPPSPPCCARPHCPFQPPQGPDGGWIKHFLLFEGFHAAPHRVCIILPLQGAGNRAPGKGCVCVEPQGSSWARPAPQPLLALGLVALIWPPGWLQWLRGREGHRVITSSCVKPHLLDEAL